ncbi:MAG: hypothetical protein RMN51_05385 [Verrucomicrobiota bacterium]|nr:hypothetical protein [Limisphaera sp.]MDW8381523.1 hypothetical protein [Verrucomicrobiota bacterium]
MLCSGLELLLESRGETECVTSGNGVCQMFAEKVAVNAGRSGVLLQRRGDYRLLRLAQDLTQEQSFKQAAGFGQLFRFIEGAAPDELVQGDPRCIGGDMDGIQVHATTG